MNKMEALINAITREGIMSHEEVIAELTEALACSKPMKEVYTDLYTRAYGYKITKDMAEELVKQFPVTDGSGRTSGERWTYSDTKEVQSNLNMREIDPCEFYLVMNSMYSDYYRTMNKHGIDDPEAYADLAWDWFMDADADEHKTFYYFMM